MQKCLDVNPDDNMIVARDCADFSGQYWKIEGTLPGPLKLTTMFRGPDLCLDVIPEGAQENMIHLVACGNFTGQHWNFRSFEGG
jgi:hypothetical protein